MHVFQAKCHYKNLKLCTFLYQVHVQNATLAGGVAVGTAANFIIQPWGAVLIGFLAAIVSTLGFQYLQVSTGLEYTSGNLTKIELNAKLLDINQMISNLHHNVRSGYTAK